MTFAKRGPAARPPVVWISTLALGLWACSSDEDSLTVPREPVPTSVTVAPDAVSLTALGDTSRLTATVNDREGLPIDVAVDWETSDAAIAAVADGLVTAVANGSVVISATAGGAVGTVTVAVEQMATSIEVTPPSAVLLASGDTIRLSHVAYDSNDNVVDGHTAAWLSSDSTVATVTSDGLATGQAGGETMISATDGAAIDSAAVRVFDALTITTDLLSGGAVAYPFTDTVRAVGGGGAYTWSIGAGALPDGLSLAPSTGVIDGILEAAGTSSFTVSVRDTLEQTVDAALEIVVSPSPTLVARPGILAFEGTAGGGTTDQPLWIVSETGASLAWEASADQSWIALDGTTGMVSDSVTVQVTVDASGLGGGWHSGTVTVREPVSGTQTLVTVQLVVTPAAVARPLVVTRSLELHAVTTFGGDRVTLTDRAELNIRWAEWSPSGTEIAFTGNPPGDRPALWVMSADGANKVQVSTTVNSVSPWAEWSPDGQRLVYAATGSLFVVDRDGANTTDVTPAEGWASTPSWSPDGQWIAYQGVDASGAAGIFRARPDGSGATLIFEMGQDVNKIVRYSPTDARLAFAHFNDIWVVDDDGSNVRRLINTPDSGDSYPTWSPDGKRIAYQADGGSYYVISILNAETGVVEGVWGQPNVDDAAYPAWSPDGSQLAFKVGGSVLIADTAVPGAWTYSTSGLWITWHPGG